MPPVLTLRQRDRERIAMIKQALKDQAPETYRHLKREKKLHAWADEYETAMMESYYRAEGELRFRVIGPKGPEDPMERIRQMDALLDEFELESFGCF